MTNPTRTYPVPPGYSHETDQYNRFIVYDPDGTVVWWYNPDGTVRYPEDGSMSDDFFEDDNDVQDDEPRRGLSGFWIFMIICGVIFLVFAAIAAYVLSYHGDDRPRSAAPPVTTSAPPATSAPATTAPATTSAPSTSAAPATSASPTTAASTASSTTSSQPSQAPATTTTVAPAPPPATSSAPQVTTATIQLSVCGYYQANPDTFTTPSGDAYNYTKEGELTVGHRYEFTYDTANPKTMIDAVYLGPSTETCPSY